MAGLVRIVDVIGTGSSAVVQRNNIVSNVFAEDQTWIGFQARDKASLSVRNSLFSQNEGLEALFSATASSNLEIQSTDVQGAIGAQGLVRRIESMKALLSKS